MSDSTIVSPLRQRMMEDMVVRCEDCAHTAIAYNSARMDGGA